MNKRDLAYKLYEAGVIAFDDYQCVDCGGSNILVDSFYACAVEIKAAAGRDGFIAGFNTCFNYEGMMNLSELSNNYAQQIKNGW